MNHDAAQHRIDDIDLAAAIAASLQFNGNAVDVTVNVTDGVVTLEGEVDTPQKRQAAESAARRFHVAGVINALTVRKATDRRTPESDGHRPVSG